MERGATCAPFAKTMSELVAYAKAHPKALNYASPNTYALVATGMFSAAILLQAWR